MFENRIKGQKMKFLRTLEFESGNPSVLHLKSVATSSMKILISPCRNEVAPTSYAKKSFCQAQPKPQGDPNPN